MFYEGSGRGCRRHEFVSGGDEAEAYVPRAASRTGKTSLSKDLLLNEASSAFQNPASAYANTYQRGSRSGLSKANKPSDSGPRSLKSSGSGTSSKKFLRRVDKVEAVERVRMQNNTVIVK